jgi:hypothetical protein
MKNLISLFFITILTFSCSTDDQFSNQTNNLNFSENYIDLESVPDEAELLNLPLPKLSKEINEKEKKYLQDILKNHLNTGNKINLSLKGTLKNSYQNGIDMFSISNSNLVVYKFGENFLITKSSVLNLDNKKHYSLKTLNGKEIFAFDFQIIKQSEFFNNSEIKHYVTNFKTFHNDTFDRFSKKVGKNLNNAIAYDTKNDLECARKADDWQGCVDATMGSTEGIIIAAIPGGYPAILLSCVGAGPDATC